MTKSDGKTPQKRLNYGGLVESIARLHMRTQVGAAAAVNQFLTLRNWLIGACIVEFEQRGSDRARYGERLLSCLSEDLAKRGIRGCSQDRLEWMRRFYVVYPQIRQTLSDESLSPVTLSRISPDAPEAKVHRIGVELPDVPRRSPFPARRRPSSPERACVILAYYRMLPERRQPSQRLGQRARRGDDGLERAHCGRSTRVPRSALHPRNAYHGIGGSGQSRCRYSAGGDPHELPRAAKGGHPSRARVCG